MTWGDRWMTENGEAPVELRHKECGATMHPQLACPSCGESLEARAVEPVVKHPARTP
ncbi:MAG: hypothetical protein WEB19_02575 [Acidimicrobiia bacterium]